MKLVTKILLALISCNCFNHSVVKTITGISFIDKPLEAFCMEFCGNEHHTKRKIRNFKSLFKPPLSLCVGSD